MSAVPLGPDDLAAALARVRDVHDLRPRPQGRVVALPGGGWAVTGTAWDLEFAHHLAGVAASRAALTTRKYAYGCLALARYADAFGVPLGRWTRTEASDMVRHLRVAENPQRRRAPGSGTPLPGTLDTATGKRALAEGYSARHINALLIAAHGFFEWYAEHGGPVANPVPSGAARDSLGRGTNDNRNPLDPFRRPARRADLRQPVPEWLPRRIRPDHLDELRGDLRTDRDRCMFTVLEDSAVRANELVTLQDANLDPRAGTARVYGKGRRGGTREVPFSPQAFELVGRSRDELLRSRRVRVPSSAPLFWTLGRKEPQPLGYQSLRSWWRALNARHGWNYTLHDMRHTAAFRMVESGHLTLPQVQAILGHAHLATTQLYLRPMTSEIVAAAGAWWADAERREASGLNLAAVAHLDADDLAEVFGGLL